MLVSGSTGLIGRSVVQAFRDAGDVVIPLVRGPSAAASIRWNPGVEPLSPTSVSGFDIVIHLAGEPVLGLWTKSKKHRIRSSRVDGTHALATALAAAPQPPRLFLCASGINFYGDCAEGIVDESAASGAGFLAEVCRVWEAASAPLRPPTRMVHLRIGVVLSREGGTLGAMLPLFRLGLGGVIGSGCGYISWIGLKDVVCAMQHLVNHEELSGPVNLVAPHPVTSGEFSRELAAAVHRPAWVRVPAWAAKLAMGELAKETILGSVRARPARLLQSGFRFAQPTLPEALAAESIGGPRPKKP